MYYYWDSRKTYFGKNLATIEDLLLMIQGKTPWKRRITNTLRKLRCFMFGHIFGCCKNWTSKEEVETELRILERGW